MTDVNVDTQAQDKFDTGAQVGGPQPTQGPPPVIGLTTEQEAELQETVYTFMLGSGAVMQFRLFSTAEEFVTQMVEGGVALVMTQGHGVDRVTGAGQAAWVPFYVNLDKVLGFSPITFTDASAALDAGVAGEAANSNNIDVV